MKRWLWISATGGVVLLLALGLYRASRPAEVRMSVEEARERLETLAVRFNAAIENRRGVEPLREPARAVVAQHPGLRDGRMLLGQIHLFLDEVGPAYEQFNAALAIDPDDAQLQNLAGTAALMLGDTPVAHGHHARAAELAPDRPRLLLPLADVLLKQGLWEEARAVVERALGIQLSLYEANALLSDIYANRGEPGDLQRALEEMERTLVKLPKEEETRADRHVYTRKLARLYARAGDPHEALRLVEALPPEARFTPEVLAESASYFDAAGRAVLAALQYELALDVFPDQTGYLAEAARWYLKAGDVPAARAAADRLARLEPGHPAVADLERALSGGSEGGG